MLDRLLETQEGIVVERDLEDGIESFDGSVVVFKANDERATAAGLDLRASPRAALISEAGHELEEKEAVTRERLTSALMA